MGFQADEMRVLVLLQITIAYPDEGAWKRFHGLISGYPEVCCSVSLLSFLCEETGCQSRMGNCSSHFMVQTPSHDFVLLRAINI